MCHLPLVYGQIATKDNARVQLSPWDSFLVAYHNERDVHHAAAREVMGRFLAGEWGRGLLLEYVFLEVTTVLLVRRGLELAVAVGQILLQSRELDFVACSDLFLETVECFGRQQGTAALSFADAALVGAARKFAEGRIATFDAEFGKVPGLTVVPGS